MSNHRYNNKLRVIAGQWRGRVIQFKPGPGVRPTPDRVRETVFNWLRPRIEGAHCLDLFAGSGLLGIEALSQGAKSSTFLDNSKQNIQTLKKKPRAFKQPAQRDLSHRHLKVVTNPFTATALRYRICRSAFPPKFCLSVLPIAKRQSLAHATGHVIFGNRTGLYA